MSAGYLIFALILSIVLILLAIVFVKINPAIALILGALLLGIMTGVPLLDVTADGEATTGLVSVINNGFGNMLGSIGFPIGFGIILGQLVSDMGGANVIADRLVRFFPEDKALYAVAFAGFVLSIPVFFDVTFVILIPIGMALIKKINKPLCYIIGSITVGAGIAHTMIPPTPNPLAAPEYFGFDLGIMILAGVLLGIPMVLIGVKIYTMILDRGIWKSSDENGLGLQIDEMNLPERLPSFGISLLPIFVPIILIVLNTICSTAMGSSPVVIEFLGQKTISMLVGTLVAFIVACRYLGLKGAEKSSTEALKSAGMVFLITGAGGAFSSVITASGVSDAIKNMISGISGNVIVILLLCWVIGLLFRQITGSGTVASLTTMGIMTSVAAVTPIHPVFIALACLDGAMFGCTVNDSGFWIVTNMSGFEVSGGIKTYTLAEAVASTVGIVLICIVGCISCLF